MNRVAEAKSTILEGLESYILNADEGDHYAGDVQTARRCKRLIEGDEPLPKEDAKWIEHYINLTIIQRMNAYMWADKQGRPQNMALKIDELSIYTDIWDEYCRPGRYSL
jgi:hypothetical protein